MRSPARLMEFSRSMAARIELRLAALFTKTVRSRTPSFCSVASKSRASAAAPLSGFVNSYWSMPMIRARTTPFPAGPRNGAGCAEAAGASINPAARIAVLVNAKRADLGLRMAVRCFDSVSLPFDSSIESPNVLFGEAGPISKEQRFCFPLGDGDHRSSYSLLSQEADDGCGALGRQAHIVVLAPALIRVADDRDPLRILLAQRGCQLISRGLTYSRQPRRSRLKVYWQRNILWREPADVLREAAADRSIPVILGGRNENGARALFVRGEQARSICQISHSLDSRFARRIWCL